MIEQDRTEVSPSENISITINLTIVGRGTTDMLFSVEAVNPALDSTECKEPLLSLSLF